MNHGISTLQPPHQVAQEVKENHFPFVGGKTDVGALGVFKAEIRSGLAFLQIAIGSHDGKRDESQANGDGDRRQAHRRSATGFAGSSQNAVHINLYIPQRAGKLSVPGLSERFHAEAAQHQKLRQIVGRQQSQQIGAIHHQGAPSGLRHQRKNLRQVRGRLQQ